MLAFQAGFFYLPHLVWKSQESKLLGQLTDKMRSPVTKEDRPVDTLVGYLANEKRSHNAYFRNFWLCELSNFLNVILQIYIVDVFLGGTFTQYGWNVLNMDDEDRNDPMSLVFPKMTKCTFHRYGPSGDVNRYDALCILPLNIINEKIYFIMWFWFVFLAIVTGLFGVYRLFTLTQPSFRYKVLRRRALHAKAHHLRTILRVRNQPGDWFMLYMLCKNMDSGAFNELAKELADKLKQAKPAKLKDVNRSHKSSASRDDDDDDDSDEDQDLA